VLCKASNLSIEYVNELSTKTEVNHFSRKQKQKPRLDIHELRMVFSYKYRACSYARLGGEPVTRGFVIRPMSHVHRVATWHTVFPLIEAGGGGLRANIIELIAHHPVAL